MPTRFYHFTCQHHARLIHRSGHLLPNHHPLVGRALIWLTDLPEPDRWGLGLTANWLTCDRTAVRVTVQPTEGIVAWSTWALWHKVPHAIVELLEESARPDHWWVATDRLKVSGIAETAVRSSRRSS